ncbi:hypothetical protein ACHAWF_016669, partial [Thalassiosira exigua]
DKGPQVGYYLEDNKSWTVCPRTQEEELRRIFEGMGLRDKFTGGHHLVGGFVGLEAMADCWVKPQVEAWVQGIETLASVAACYPHTAHDGLVVSLQAEWQYLCHMATGVEKHFGPVEDSLRTCFVPVILDLNSPTDNEWRWLLGNSAKQGGLAIRNPLESAPCLHQAS